MSPALAKKSVLLVDDDVEIIDALRTYLGDEGFEVAQATDGIDALSYIYATRPSVVLIDLMMPRMTGLELIEQIRNDRRLATLPVVAISGSRDMLVRARKAGANEVLAKPIEPDKIAQALTRSCR